MFPLHPVILQVEKQAQVENVFLQSQPMAQSARTKLCIPRRDPCPPRARETTAPTVRIEVYKPGSQAKACTCSLPSSLPSPHVVPRYGVLAAPIDPPSEEMTPERAVPSLN